MRFDIFTLFPEFFASPLSSSILKRGQEAGAIEIGVHDIRDGATDKHRACDDYPYGGGAGMVMKAEPVAAMLGRVLKWEVGLTPAPCPIVLMSPQGRTLNQGIVEELSGYPQIAVICAHYEGLDERAVQLLVTDEISIGDYILTGGEVASLVLVDAVSRLQPGVLGNQASHQSDSFSDGLLEAPHWTRPVEWRGMAVPDVLLGGHHAQIERWRRKEGLRRTLERRPDLLQQRELSDEERTLIAEILSDGDAATLNESTLDQVN